MTTTTSGGTPVFMAPELLSPGTFNRSSARPTQPADIYALGMVIYEVLTGFPPFHEERWVEYETAHYVITGARPTKPTNIELIGSVDGTWELVQECWSGESAKRPTIDQVLAHLTRVAAYSKVVGPTRDKPRENAVNSTGSDSSGKLFILSSCGCPHPPQGHISLFLSRPNSTDTTPPSPANIHSTAPIPAGYNGPPDGSGCTAYLTSYFLCSQLTSEKYR